MAKNKRKTTIYKAKTKDRATRNPTKNRGWTHVLRKGRQFLPH